MIDSVYCEEVPAECEPVIGEEIADEPVEFEFPVHDVQSGEVWAVGHNRVACYDPRQMMGQIERFVGDHKITRMTLLVERDRKQIEYICELAPELASKMVHGLEVGNGASGAVIDRME